MDWTQTKEGRDSAAAWAITHLRGVPADQRIPVLERLLQKERMTGVSAEDLNKWCHAYMQPDIASRLCDKHLEFHETALAAQAAPEADEADDEMEATRLRAEGFRVAIEGLGLGQAINARWWYPKRQPGGRHRKWIGKGVVYRAVDGAGTVTLMSGEVVSWVTCCVLGERDGATVWALPEAGRLWFDAERGVLRYEVRQIERLDPRAVIGARAIALAATYAPAVVDHRPQAQVAREHGIPSKQLLHHHQRAVRARLEGLRPASTPG